MCSCSSVAICMMRCNKTDLRNPTNNSLKTTYRCHLIVLPGQASFSIHTGYSGIYRVIILNHQQILDALPELILTARLLLRVTPTEHPFYFMYWQNIPRWVNVLQHCTRNTWRVKQGGSWDMQYSQHLAYELWGYSSNNQGYVRSWKKFTEEISGRITPRSKF